MNNKYLTQKINIEEGKFTESEKQTKGDPLKVEKRQSSISGALSPKEVEAQNITDKIGNALMNKLGISIPTTG